MNEVIVLVGSSGAGKSTIGPLLATKLGRPFLDVDAEIVREQGRPVSDIFATDGEAHFRRLERDATLAAFDRDAVVALGGGAPMTPAVADALRALSQVIWLRVSAEEATRRVGNDPRRPLLSRGDALATLTAMLAAREPVYADVSDVAVSTDGRPSAAVVDDIISFIRSRENA